MENHWLDDNRTALVPILTVGVLVVVYLIFQSLFIKCDRGIAQCEPFNASYVFSASNNHPINNVDRSVNGQDKERAANLKLIAERYSRRLVWVFLIAVSVIVALASLLATSRLIYKSGSFRGESSSIRIVVSITLSLLVGFLLWRLPDNYMPVMQKILELTIAQGQLGMPTILDTMTAINSITYVAAFALVISSCAIVLPRKAKGEIDAGKEDEADKQTDSSSHDSTDSAKKLSILSEQMKDLRVVLYVGTLVLIIGVLRMTAVTQWTLSFISPDALEAAQNFYVNLSSVTGGFYSLILAGVYLPAAYVLQRRANQVAKELPPDKQQEALKSKELTFSFRESMPRILAILGPLLAGPIGEMLKSVPNVI